MYKRGTYVCVVRDLNLGMDNKRNMVVKPLDQRLVAESRSDVAARRSQTFPTTARIAETSPEDDGYPKTEQGYRRAKSEAGECPDCNRLTELREGRRMQCLPCAVESEARRKRSGLRNDQGMGREK